jgi:hypothetical protein
MANRTDPIVARKIDRIEITDPFPAFESSSSPRSRKFSKSEVRNIDEVIVSLSDEYENKRARQVVEWVRQQSVRRAA